MVHAAIYTIVGLFLLTYVGNWVCRKVFKITGLEAATAEEVPPTHNAGRLIGILERLILATGVVVHSWEILAAVIALKTVARFQKLDQREFAEYFLVGSLLSILWTMVVTTAWLAYDHELGIDLRQKIITMLGP